MLPTAPHHMANALRTDASWWATHHDLTAKFATWLASGSRGLAGSAR